MFSEAEKRVQLSEEDELGSSGNPSDEIDQSESAKFQINSHHFVQYKYPSMNRNASEEGK